MYTREYDIERVPEGYSGVALGELAPEPETRECVAPEPPRKPGILGGIEAIFKGLIPSVPSGFHIGLEEILIIASAALLFFSKERDSECAIMLLVLLFIF